VGLELGQTCWCDGRAAVVRVLSARHAAMTLDLTSDHLSGTWAISMTLRRSHAGNRRRRWAALELSISLWPNAELTKRR